MKSNLPNCLRRRFWAQDEEMGRRSPSTSPTLRRGRIQITLLKNGMCKKRAILGRKDGKNYRVGGRRPGDGRGLPEFARKVGFDQNPVTFITRTEESKWVPEQDCSSVSKEVHGNRREEDLVTKTQKLKCHVEVDKATNIGLADSLCECKKTCEEMEVWRCLGRHKEDLGAHKRNTEAITENAWKLSQSSDTKGRNLVQAWDSFLSPSKRHGRTKDIHDTAKVWMSPKKVLKGCRRR